MKKLRVLALMHDYLVPPDNTKGHDVATAEWKTEHDVATTLRALGHDVRVLGVKDDLGVIRQTNDEFKPHIAFNLMEAFHEVGSFDMNVVSYLELLRLPYTGCNPRGMVLSRDKALAKKLFAYHRIPVPESGVVGRRRACRLPSKLHYPVIVKSLSEQASAGISQASVVDDDAKLRERVQFIHDTLGTDALVERYIDGRELYVGVLGNERLQVLPVWEMDFTGMPDGVHRIATERVKRNLKYQNRHGITTTHASLSSAKVEEIQKVTKRAFRALDMTGYARMDFRLDAAGNVYVLEGNANPHLAEGEDLADSAKRAGIEYDELLQRIINFGLRWQPERAG
jgi:D-alanine-D-alanine ligase